jgi:hypothetical protein
LCVMRALANRHRNCTCSTNGKASRGVALQRHFTSAKLLLFRWDSRGARPTGMCTHPHTAVGAATITLMMIASAASPTSTLKLRRQTFTTATIEGILIEAYIGLEAQLIYELGFTRNPDRNRVCASRTKAIPAARDQFVSSMYPRQRQRQHLRAKTQPQNRSLTKNGRELMMRGDELHLKQQTL